MKANGAESSGLINAANFPHLFGDALPSPSAVQLAERLLIGAPQGAPSAFDERFLQAAAAGFSEADYQFGHSITSLGTVQQRPPDGLYNTYMMPTFYHDGVGTRLATLGAKRYMDFFNSVDPDSPYQDPYVYRRALLAGVFDDMIFGEFGRGGDERASERLARTYLKEIGFVAMHVKPVCVSIRASTYDQLTGKQQLTPEWGYYAEQKASVGGDTWAIGTHVAGLYAPLLALEDLWKLDAAFLHNQVLREAAVETSIQTGGIWLGKTAYDFFDLAQKYERARQYYGAFLRSNQDYITLKHRFPDDEVNDLMRPSKQQNGRLQYLMGSAVLAGEMTVTDTFHCGYAYAALSRAPARPMPYPKRLTAEVVWSMILSDRTPQELQEPLDAENFFDRYINGNAS